MNEVENDLPEENGSQDLQGEVASLRQQVWTLLVLMLVVSGTFSIYLMREVTYARKDLDAEIQLIDQSKGMDQFVQRLGEYSRTHPDFVPILTKYGITVTGTPAPNPSAPKK
jgi:hypothetical protein